jgi:hypothetical protein
VFLLDDGRLSNNSLLILLNVLFINDSGFDLRIDFLLLLFLNRFLNNLGSSFYWLLRMLGRLVVIFIFLDILSFSSNNGSSLRLLLFFANFWLFLSNFSLLSMLLILFVLFVLLRL